ncbi:LuxR family transcriptional regulator [Plantactinospora sp. KBS50]|uniref:LuxR family transcriptional regulator n=1 Tax=Plantactinospora sp. KBS50 TaxID=2024580 RepID=UPI001E3B35A9|nr:LuxR family transcriptional regulator [Plantactinospora sp. KBS50]
MTGAEPLAGPPAVRWIVASMGECAVALTGLERGGYHPARGFSAVGPVRPVVLRYGPVVDSRGADLVLRIAARGGSVLAVLDPAGTLGRSLAVALRRCGPVRLGVDRGGQPVPGAGQPAVEDSRVLDRLVPEQRALLNRLANGETIAAAAAAEFLSLRTANRRIAQVRHLLGVHTTRDAVRIYLRQRPPGDG